MADSKITALDNLTSADPANDMIPIVDVSATPPASGNTKRISINNLLACSPSATLASATISGDLTVRTNKLFVNATGVGVNYTSPAVALHVGTTGATNKFCINTAVTSAGDIQLRRGAFIGFSNAADAANSEYLFANGGALELGIGGTTAMTLNSTGLGVGVSPSYKLDVQGADNSIIAQFGGVGGRKVNFTTSANGGFANGFFNFVSTSSVGAFSFQNTSGTLLTIDNGGNVGIGVTPVNKLTIGTGTFNASTVSGSSSLYSTVAQGLVILADGLAVATRGGVNKLIANSAGDIISSVTGTAPSLTDNGFMVFNLTSNTNLRISVRGSDGTTRVANITLA